MKSTLLEKLKPLKEAQKVPHVLLFTGVSEENREQTLSEAASFLEGVEISEARGNKILLDSEKETSLKVDDVRELLKKISLRNWDEKSSRYVLIPRAELLTTQSSNALLKSLEEAPSGTYFLMCAPSRKSLLKTILSRSFVIYLNDQESDEAADTNTVFKEAFFKKNFEPLTQVSKSDLKKEWEDFSRNLKNDFCEKVYTGELDNTEWYRLFDFMSEVEQKISANMDTKWLKSSIERFDFNG